MTIQEIMQNIQEVVEAKDEFLTLQDTYASIEFDKKNYQTAIECMDITLNVLANMLVFAEEG